MKHPSNRAERLRSKEQHAEKKARVKSRKRLLREQLKDQETQDELIKLSDSPD